ncbi:MAG: cytochrome c [Acidobacteriota bacterium]|nr:cytochrome c [Acidobacteriota bacterium]
MRLLIASLACATIAAAAATTSVPVTFTKNVLPILQKNCQGCHRPGEAAPMSFLTYDSTRPWAKAIKQAVLTKKMPPWFADPHFGKFGNDRTLAQSDIDTLVAWVDGGGQEGNPKDAPKPIAFVEGWRIGKPDMIIEMPVAFEIPASGTVDYQYVVIPAGLTEDKYVQMAEARPGNNALVHHIIAFIREPGSPWLKDAPKGVAFAPNRNGGRSGAALGDSLAGYAPGVTPRVLQPGQAKLIKAGSDIVLQMHYTANGTAGADKSRIGLVFATQKPTERVLSIAAANMNFLIPAGNPNYEVGARLVLQADSTLVSLLPHMHFRGKDFIYRVTYPTGEKETLLSVPHYDFNWQLSYDLAQPKVLPKGTVIECVAHYDNSANNRYNPDPTKDVRFGEQTWEEMMFGFFDVAVPVDVSARDLMFPKAKPSPSSSGSGQ